MSIFKKAGLAATALILSACQTPAKGAGVPALLTNPSAQTNTALEAAISGALNGRHVTLASGAFTKRPDVIIELAAYSTLGGAPMDGRRMDRPDHFTLKARGANCFLVHEETGEVYKLSGVECKAA